MKTIIAAILMCPAAAWAADQGVLAAESSYMQADYERKSTLYALLVVCGVGEQPARFPAEGGVR